MSRFALALAAILILTLSVGLMRGQPQGKPVSTGAANATVFHENANAFRDQLLLMQHEALPSIAQPASDEESPAPALLIYLALILIGSTVSVALARRRLQRKI